MRSRFGAAAGLTLATFLGGVSLAGASLYVSAVASAAVQDQLAHACRSESALELGVPAGADRRAVERIGSQVPNVDPPIFSTTSPVRLQSGSNLPLSITLLTRDGDGQAVNPPLKPLGLDEVAVPKEVLDSLGAQVGDHLVAQSTNGTKVDLVITQTFDNLPFRPEPDYWCGFATLLRPTAGGDPGPKWGVVSSETHAAFADRTTSWLEFRPTQRAITMPEARAIEAGYVAATAAHAAEFGPLHGASSLPALLDHASGLTTGVARSVAPARIAGVVAAFLTLLAAATFLAKEREQELRLFAIRGEPPWRTAVHLLRALWAPIALGAVLGLVTAWASVRTLGPSSVVESGVLIRSTLVVAVAAVVALAVVVTYVAFLGDRLVDVSRSGRRWSNLPFELVAVPLAVVSYLQLTDGGALQMIGVHPQGGRLLAQGFPLFGLLAVAALIHRPLRWLASTSRTSGSRLPRAVRLGLRRVVLDARAAALLVVVFFIAAGCFTTAMLLSQTSEQEIRDKANTYVGADLAVDVFGDVPAAALVGRVTEVSRISGHLGGDSVDILGVDRATFAAVAHMPPGASSRPLSSLLDEIAPTPGGGLRAILVAGGSLGGTVRVESSVGRPDILLTVVATTRYFPGSSSGLVAVVDRDALEQQASFAQHSLWFTAPPPDVVERLRDQGVRVGQITRASAVFDTTNYRAQAWSYAPLGALAVLFVLIALGIQVLIVSARRTGRQQAHVVMHRTGFRTPSLWRAALVEVAIPTVLGTALGTCAGIVLSRVSLGHLDSLPTVAPSPRLIASAATFVASGLVVATMIVVVAGIIVRSTLRGDPMKAIRGFDAGS